MSRCKSADQTIWMLSYPVKRTPTCTQKISDGEMEARTNEAINNADIPSPAPKQVKTHLTVDRAIPTRRPRTSVPSSTHTLECSLAGSIIFACSRHHTMIHDQSHIASSFIKDIVVVCIMDHAFSATGSSAYGDLSDTSQLAASVQR